MNSSACETVGSESAYDGSYVETREASVDDCVSSVSRQCWSLADAGLEECREALFRREGSVTAGSSWGKVPMWIFSSEGERLVPRKPLLLEVEDDGQVIFVSSGNFHVHAIGVTYEAALESFTEQLIHFYKKYENTPDGGVVGLAVRLKKIYNESFHYHVVG
jgi:hypothetical protein